MKLIVYMLMVVCGLWVRRAVSKRVLNILHRGVSSRLGPELPCFQGKIILNERRLPGLGASPVYNFLLVATIPQKYVSGC